MHFSIKVLSFSCFVQCCRPHLCQEARSHVPLAFRLWVTHNNAEITTVDPPSIAMTSSMGNSPCNSSKKHKYDNSFLSSIKILLLLRFSISEYTLQWCTALKLKDHPSWNSYLSKAFISMEVVGTATLKESWSIWHAERVLRAVPGCRESGEWKWFAITISRNMWWIVDLHMCPVWLQAFLCPSQSLVSLLTSTLSHDMFPPGHSSFTGRVLSER